MKLRSKKVCLCLSAFILFIGILAPLMVPSQKADALSGSDFKPGRIIDDTIFYNDSSMSVAQIQKFLDAKLPDCDTNGSVSISYYYNSSNGRVGDSRDTWVTTTRATYGQRYQDYWASLPESDRNPVPPGSKAPFTCINTYKQTVQSITNGGSDLCKNSISGGTKSSAQIIYDVAKACGINPQVLIVLLQKEQSLITDTWPWGRQYSIATGYGCPDTAPCDSEYYGFFNQVYQAAKAFRRYEANPTWYNYRHGRNNTIYYHPDLARCGSSTVFIENQATASLYIYTPYQPNKAALDNLYGTGDSCSAYGNRNFWRMFNDWFGPTVIDYNSERVTGPGSSSTVAPIGEEKTVSVRFTNTGTQPWYDTISASETGNRPVVLVASHLDGSHSGFNGSFATPTRATEVFDTVYHNGEPKVNNKRIVQPGQEVKLTFKIKTPASIKPGQYHLLYQLVIPTESGKKRIYIGQQHIYYINTGYSYNSIDASQSSTVKVVSGESTQVLLKVKNTGLKTWYDTRGADINNSRPVVLVATHINGSHSGFNGSFATPTRATEVFDTVFDSNGSVKSSENDRVAPGETAQFKFTLKSPDLPSNTYHLTYQLVIPATSSGAPRIDIGNKDLLNINIPILYDGTRVRGEGSSSTVLANGTQKTVSVQFINTGTKPWYDTISASETGNRPVVLVASHLDGSHSGFNGSFATPTRATETFSAVYDKNGTLKTADKNTALPGERVKFTFDIKAPSGLSNGTYHMIYRPVIPAINNQPRIDIGINNIYYINIE